MFGPLLLLTLTQSSVDVAVVVSSRREPAAAKKVAHALVEVLAPTAHVLNDEAAKARLAELGGVDPVTCDGARLCLGKLAELLGPTSVVIGIDVAKAGRFQSAHVEAIAPGKVESLLADDFTSDSKAFDADSKKWAKGFAERLQVKLKTLAAEREAAQPKPQPPPPTVAPTVEPLPPVSNVPPPPPPLTEPAPSRAPAWVFTAGAVATAVAGGVLFGLGLSDKAHYDNSQRTFLGGTNIASSLTLAEINATVNRSNTELSFSLGFGIAAAVATALAIYFFTR